MLRPAAEAFPERRQQVLDLPIIDRRGSSDPILLGMVLSPRHNRLCGGQIILLEVLELLVIDPAHVVGGEDAFLEYISFHGRGKMYYTALKKRKITSLLFVHLVPLEVVRRLAVVDQLEQPCCFLLALLLPQVDHHLHRVLQDHFDQSSGDWGRVVHRRAAVDLDQPGLQPVVDHEIIPNQFERVPSAIYLILSADYGCNDDFLHPGNDFFELAFSSLQLDILLQLLHAPHRLVLQLLQVDLGVVLLDGVVGQVRELVAQFKRVVFLQAEAEVELGIEPDARRVVVLDQHPLADVEFPPVYYQWVLDVLLHHVLCLLAQ